MAAQRAFEAFLTTQMKADSNERAVALIDGGLSGFDSFTDFEESDIITLCNTLRRPGGTIERTENGVTSTEPNRGIAITTVCEMRLKMACYAAKYYKMVGRPVDAISMMWDRIKHFKDLKVIIKIITIQKTRLRSPRKFPL